MIAARGLIVVIVIFHEEGRVVGEGIDDPAAEFIISVFIIGGALLVERLWRSRASCRTW